MEVLLILVIGLALACSEPTVERKIRKDKKLFYKVILDKIRRKG